MKFQNNQTTALFGKIVGFLFAYFLFSTILFFVLRHFGKLQDAAWWHVLILTLLIVATGKIIQILLK